MIEQHIKNAGKCANCMQHARHVCSGCYLTTYCGSECQIVHWGEDHSKTCKEIQNILFVQGDDNEDDVVEPRQKRRKRRNHFERRKNSGPRQCRCCRRHSRARRSGSG